MPLFFEEKTVKKPNQVITKVRTGTGDEGLTHLAVPNVPKDASDVQFVGELDEANAFIGRLFPETSQAEQKGVIWKRLRDSQGVLFAMGAAVHSHTAHDACDRLLSQYVEEVEALIEKIREDVALVKLKGFIRPEPKNADLMMARAVVRRAERSAVGCGAIWAVPALNIMSDLLFMLAWMKAEPTDLQWGGIDDTP